MPKLTLFPVPYLAIDHKCRLAGITPELEPLRKGPVPPLNRKIGATLHMVDGSYKPDSRDGFFPGRGDVFYVYTSDPVEVVCEDGHVDEYRKMVERGDVLDASKELPLEALAKARLKATADFVAHYGRTPDTASWSAQFPLDADVAEVAEVLAKKLQAEAEAKAKSAADEAKSAAVAAREKVEARSAAKDAIKRRLTSPDPMPAKPAAKPQKD